MYLLEEYRVRRTVADTVNGSYGKVTLLPISQQLLLDILSLSISSGFSGSVELSCAAVQYITVDLEMCCWKLNIHSHLVTGCPEVLLLY